MATAAIGKRGRHADISALIRAVRDPDLVVRRAAVIALGLSKDPRGLYPLNIVFCSSESLLLRLLAGGFLAQMGDQGLGCIVLAMQSGNAELRTVAGQIRDRMQGVPGFEARWYAGRLAADQIEAQNADPHRWDDMPGMGGDSQRNAMQ